MTSLKATSLRYYIKGHLSMYRKERDSSGEDMEGVATPRSLLHVPEATAAKILQGLFLGSTSHI